MLEIGGGSFIIQGVGVKLDLAGEGPYLRYLIEQYPAYIPPSEASLHRFYTSEDFYIRMESDLGEYYSEEALKATLRRHQKIEFSRIYSREILRIATISEVTAEISAFTDAAIALALRYCVEEAVANNNVDEFAAIAVTADEILDRLVIFGLGKLGGEELNYSSDIDIVVVAEPVNALEEQAEKQYFQYISCIVKRLIHILEHHTNDGFLYRVDLRLRPFGTQGPIVSPRRAFVDYYQNWGRSWERAALLKARPVAGNLAFGTEILALLDSFVFRKYLDYEAIDEIKAIKQQIDAEGRALQLSDRSPSNMTSESPQLSRRDRLKKHRRKIYTNREKVNNLSCGKLSGKVSVETTEHVDNHKLLGWDLKVGKGGIREIEFFVQALQLVHCGKQPELRQRNTLIALSKLRAFGYITDSHFILLSTAYDFFRRVEHRIQMYANQQRHTLPKSLDSFVALAHRCGYKPDDFHKRLEDMSSQVYEIFHLLLEDAASQKDDQPTVATSTNQGLAPLALVAPYLSDEQLAALRKLGFRKPRQVAGQLHTLQSKVTSPFHPTATSKASRLALYLVENAANTPDPDRCMSHLTNFLGSLNHPEYLTAILIENPHTTRLILQLFGSSTRLATTLIRHPNSIVELLNTVNFAPIMRKDDLVADLKRRLERGENKSHDYNIFNDFFHFHLLRIAIHHLGGTYSPLETTSQLSLLAELTIATIADNTSDYFCRKNLATNPDNANLLRHYPLAIVALGKLGGAEISFTSDLDIIFIYNHESPLPASIYTKIAQRITRQLVADFYKVDTRLRPSGSQGTLVVSDSSFERYYLEHAQLWERQALLRSRVIYGDPEFRRRLQVLCNKCAVAKEGEVIAEELAQMREKIAAYYPPTKDTFDPKYEKGGLVDIEFWVQKNQLTHKKNLGKGEFATAFIKDSFMEEPIDSIYSQNTAIALKQMGSSLYANYVALRLIELNISLIEGGWDSRTLSYLANQSGFFGETAVEEYQAHCYHLLVKEDIFEY